jgi:hypothetical protein
MSKRKDLQLVVGPSAEVHAKDKRNEINTSNMAAEAYARSTAEFNDFKRDGIFRNHKWVKATA